MSTRVFTGLLSKPVRITVLQSGGQEINCFPISTQLISTVRPHSTVHINPSRERSFPKNSANQWNLETPPLRLSMRKRKTNEAFGNDEAAIIRIFPSQVLLKHKWPATVALSISYCAVWMGPQLTKSHVYFLDQ